MVTIIADLGIRSDSAVVATPIQVAKSTTSFRDERGDYMWIITKERPVSPKNIDIAMAGCLSWEARNDAIAAGALTVPVPQRVDFYG